MAQLKQLSAGSSQIIMMMFRDKNNAPIKADSVHVKGAIFTGSGAPFEFEVNKGVCLRISNNVCVQHLGRYEGGRRGYCSMQEFFFPEV